MLNSCRNASQVAVVFGGGGKARLPPPQPFPKDGGEPSSARWVLCEGDGARGCKCRRAFVSGFHRGGRSSDVMSPVSEAAETLGSRSLSLNSKTNMYLPHTPRPQATCTRFPLIHPPPAAHHSLRASRGGIETNVLLYLPGGGSHSGHSITINKRYMLLSYKRQKTEAAAFSSRMDLLMQPQRPEETRNFP